MSLQVYSTLTRKKEPFHKRPGEAVSMYVCGPTVYKPSHIGHMVGPVIFDTVKRYLTYLGYKVTWVVNITDVDDKLIVRARELKTTVPALAAQMTEDYRACLKALNVTGIDEFPKATEHVGGMIEVIQCLEKSGHAYQLDDGVYFDVSKDDDYGKLSNRDPEQMEAGTRLEVNARKRNPGDFALWKGAKPDEPPEVQYESPFKCGRGRPGWHIECTCMAIQKLGETLDIHGGGLDLQFPHHENELAQSESWTGKPFARVWMHNGLLKLKDKDGSEAKMAGSIGNVLNVADALKHVPGDALRFFMLKTHYRSPIDLGMWDWNNPATPVPDGLIEARTAHASFVRFAERVQRITGAPFAELPSQTVATERKFADPALAEAYQQFSDYLDDDFNTGGAVGVLSTLATYVNRAADDARLEDPATNNPEAKSAFVAGAMLVKEMAGILGLTFAVPQQELGGGDQLVSGLMQLLLDLRNNLRTTAKEAAKDNPLKKPLFDQTDLIRKRLAGINESARTDIPGGSPRRYTVASRWDHHTRRDRSMTPPAPTPRRILGLDPGLQVTGYGVLEVTDSGPRICEAGVIRSAEGRDPADMARRIRTLYDGLVEVLDQWSPSVMAVEQLFAHYDHPRTAILMAHARGAFLLAGAQRSIPVISYAATRVKKTVTGSGRASKDQMQHAIARELNLAGPPEPHDVADALGIALCHYFSGTGGVMGGARGATFTGINREALFGPGDLDEVDNEPDSTDDAA